MQALYAIKANFQHLFKISFIQPIELGSYSMFAAPPPPPLPVPMSSGQFVHETAPIPIAMTSGMPIQQSTEFKGPRRGSGTSGMTPPNLATPNVNPQNLNSQPQFLGSYYWPGAPGQSLSSSSPTTSLSSSSTPSSSNSRTPSSSRTSTPDELSSRVALPKRQPGILLYQDVARPRSRSPTEFQASSRSRSRFDFVPTDSADKNT